MTQPRYTLFGTFLMLVIVAFLTAGMISSKELDDDAKMKIVLSDAERFESLMQQFQMKYNALPGDFHHASIIWPHCRDRSTECNGDGDESISTAAGKKVTEAAQLWKHLELAKMLEHQFSGDLIGGHYIPGENIPATPYEGAGYLITSDIIYHHQTWQNTYFLKLAAISDWRFETPAIPLADVVMLENKADDGLPGSGKLMAYGWSKPGTHNCLKENNSDILIGKVAGHYQNPEQAENAKCSVYFGMGS